MGGPGMAGGPVPVLANRAALLAGRVGLAVRVAAVMAVRVAAVMAVRVAAVMAVRVAAVMAVRVAAVMAVRVVVIIDLSPRCIQIEPGAEITRG